MQIEAHKRREVRIPTVLTDDSSVAFESRLRQALDGGTTLLYLDCSRLEQVTSRHINALWSAYQKCKSAGIVPRLWSASPGLLRILDKLDLSEFFVDLDKTQPFASVDVAGRQEVNRGEYRDVFLSESDEINSAIHRFMTFLNGIHVPDLTAFELQTVFYEVAMNIGYHSEGPGRPSIAVTAESSDKTLQLTFMDDGKAFDPTQYMQGLDFAEAARRHQRRGFGIAMVAKLADRVTYRRQDNRMNVLIVEKDLNQ